MLTLSQPEGADYAPHHLGFVLPKRSWDHARPCQYMCRCQSQPGKWQSIISVPILVHTTYYALFVIFTLESGIDVAP